MALVLEILLGVAILASFVIAYFSARTWPIYQVLLAEFLFLSLVGFFWLGAKTLAIHKSWRTAVVNSEKELDQLQTQIQETREGGPANEQGQRDPKGIRQLRQELQKLAVDRRGVLYDVTVDSVKDGVVQTTFKSADHGLAAGSVLFAFSQAPFEQGGRYLGEFKVAAVGDDATKVQLTANLPLDEAQSQRLAKATGAITLYTTMPIDDTALFAALDEPTRQKLLPPASLAAYADAKRQLRDYEQTFHEHYVQRSLLNDAISKLSSNIQRIEAATKEAEKEAGYRQTEKDNLTADLAMFKKELQAISSYQNSLAGLYQQLREAMKTTYAANRRMVANLTAQQFQAADAIDRQADAVGAGAPQP